MPFRAWSVRKEKRLGKRRAGRRRNRKAASHSRGGKIFSALSDFRGSLDEALMGKSTSSRKNEHGRDLDRASGEYRNRSSC